MGGRGCYFLIQTLKSGPCFGTTKSLQNCENYSRNTPFPKSQNLNIAIIATLV